MNNSKNVKIYEPYTLEDLEATWKSGWKNFATFCEGLGFRRDTCTYGDDKSEEYLLLEIAGEIFDTYINQNRHIDLILPFNVLYNDLFPKEQTEIKEKETFKRGKDAYDTTMGKYLNIFLENALNGCNFTESYQKALKKLSPKTYKNNSWLTEHLGKHNQKIPKKWNPAFQLLLKAINKEISEPEAFWNCAWMFTEIELEDLRSIENAISSDIPLTEEQFFTINHYLGYGRPRGYWLRDSSAKASYEIYLEVEDYWINMFDLSKVATIVLVQPAFQISQLLQEKTSKARYTSICRAPSCGKLFYTARSNTTACPGSPGNKKNRCSLEWLRYKRYLEKIGKDPDEYWQDNTLQKLFLEYDKS